MKRQILTLLTCLCLAQLTDAQVVSGGSQVQGRTVKPSELGGSSFNGDVNLFTGTYSGSYTLGSVSTPGGLKFDVNMVYSSSLSGGDNVPVAKGIPYGEGWSVPVPTITVSAAGYKAYNDAYLNSQAALYNNQAPTNIDVSKTSFGGSGGLYWFAPIVNIPGVVNGEFVYKELDPNSGTPIFVLHKFEDQYIELHLNGSIFTVVLPNGDRYEFAGTTTYQKGYNRRTRLYNEAFNDPLGAVLTGAQSATKEHIKPKSAKLTWSCSRIYNRNLPHQLILFKYKGGGKFNFFKEFSEDDQQQFNHALRGPGSGNFTPLSLPSLPVTTDRILTEVSSNSGRVVLEYADADYYGPDMLNPNDPDSLTKRIDDLYSKKVVYSSDSIGNFNNWRRYFHSKADFVTDKFTGSWNIKPTATNPFVQEATSTLLGSNPSSDKTMLRKNVLSGQSVLSFEHCFLESPRLNHGTGTNKIPLIGGDIYEIKTTVNNPSNLAFGTANIDINIVTGLPHINGDGTTPKGTGGGVDVLAFRKRKDNYVNETIFSTFGNAVKWNPAYTAGNTVHTSNFFTMPNIPDEYNGITLQVGPGNSDNYFNFTPRDVIGRTHQGVGNGSPRNAHRTYWRENFQANFPGGWSDGIRNITKQPYEAVPHNFGIGLPWMMMKPFAHYALLNLTPNESSGMFNFWWFDDEPGFPFPSQHWLMSGQTFDNTPTLLGDQANLSGVEIIRYSKNPHLLQSVKTYKFNGAYFEPPYENPNTIQPPVLVNQFDIEYDHQSSLIVNNTFYDSNSAQLDYSSRMTTSYLLKNVKNVPVNGSKDVTNVIPTNTTEYPTTHFEYYKFEPGTPLAGATSESASLRTNAALYVLNKITSHLGKETNIDYYDFDDPAGLSFTFFRFSGPLINTPYATNHSIADRNFAVQINIPVKTIEIADQNPLISKQWDYAYENRLQQEGLNFSGISLDNTDILSGGTRNTSGGFQITTVTEPEINGVRPYSKYHHHGMVYAEDNNVTQENLLFGKLKKVENFDHTNFMVSQKELIYKANLAFKNGINRPYASKGGEIQGFEKGDDVNLSFNRNGIIPVQITTSNPGTPNVQYQLSYWGNNPTYSTLAILDPIIRYYDYHDFDHIKAPNLFYDRVSVPTGMGNVTAVAAASRAVETTPTFSNLAKDSYFIKKIKEIDTEYELDVCNIPIDNSLTQPGGGGGGITTTSEPIGNYVNVSSKQGDDQLISEIDENRYGDDIEDLLINESPLSDTVLHALMDKRPFYAFSTYSKVIAEQALLSDSVLLKTLDLPASFREDLLGEVIIHQQGELTANVLRKLIADNFENNAPLNNALLAYNFLPEDILLSMLNKEIRYSTEFITSVLLNQHLLSENVHNQLLNSTYLSDYTIKSVFINGGSYPLENTLIAMINRVPNIDPEIIEDILLASPYQHTVATLASLDASAYIPQDTYQQVIDHNFILPSWAAYCAVPPLPTILKIENITEFDYWDANEEGQTTSEGFRKLMDVTDQTIDLMFEPSWQLYSTKSYSPQLPEAFTQKEYFYYYDLKNKYNRLPKYIPINDLYNFYDELTALNIYDWEAYNIYFKINEGTTFHDSKTGLKAYLPPGLKFAQEHNLLNIAYQERTTSKNVFDRHPIARSTFYHYNSDWNDIIEDLTAIDIPYAGPPCPPNLVPTPPVPSDDDCTWVKFIQYNQADVPPGWIVYWAYDGLMMCPPTIDPVAQGYGAIYYTSPDDPLTTGNRAPYTHDLRKTLHLKEVLTQIDTLVNEEYYLAINENNNVQVTPIPFPSSTGLMEFRFDGHDNASNIYHYSPIYPFDVLKVKEVHERNQFTQVQLEENEQGLKTRYYYNIEKRVRYVDTTCGVNGYGNYSAANFPNIGVPTAITVGYGRSDSLHTAYEYYLDYSVKNITDPNGITLSYKYDAYGRLKESYRNNELLSMNKYSIWDNLSTGFTNRAKQNYVETFQLKDKGNPAALHSRKYIDPLGRDFHTMSRTVADVNALTNAANTVVHTGAITYDNWNRATATYKPFVDVNTGLFDYLAAGANPNTFSSAAYENDQNSRVLREAKPGLSLGTAQNVKYQYSMSNFICGGCDLDLTGYESRLIMGATPNDFVFKVLEVEDEDGKVSKEYFNAVGQKVATKQLIDTAEAITLFVYDSYGNLTKVINPEKQESTYKYNILGWLFQKETADGGITKYMFNESGQVVLEQDQKGRDKTSCDPVEVIDHQNGTSTTSIVDRPTYRNYEYDIFGRLTKQSKRIFHPESFYHSNIYDLPMLYADRLHHVQLSTSIHPNQTSYDLFHDGFYYTPNLAIVNAYQHPYKNAYVYKFTNNSTYSWKAKTYIFQEYNNGPNSGFQFITENNFLPTSQFFLSDFLAEKELFYNNATNVANLSQHITTNSILAAGRQNMKGNLSHTITYANADCGVQAKLVKYDFYNYNDEGNLIWQIQQFNAGGIDATHKGLVTRIDYPKYDLNNNLLVENIDVNNDLELDLQYNYTYDLRNRLQEVKVGLTDDDTRELVASYAYNDATGLVTKTNYHKDHIVGYSHLTDQINYSYDDRDRLNDINSHFFDYNLYYDANVPTTAIGQLTTPSNYNGNINGTHANYSFLGNMQNYVGGSNFEQPTSYAYTYDGINRLTYANAYWNENLLPATLTTASPVAHYGDVSYAFDKIGNLTMLSRTVDANSTIDQWQYKYQNNSNRLIQAEGMQGTSDRNYTYDGSGNLLTDDFRKVNNTIYGRANLPFDVTLLGKESQYLYDAADARIFKGLYSTDVNNIGAVLSAEYYLKDAAGNTIGILDLNTGEWTWYIFGRERFAKIKPALTQQPDFFPVDHAPQVTPIPEDPGFNTAVTNFTSEVNAILNAEPNTQVELLKVEQSNGQNFWISASNLSTFTDTVPDTSYTIAQEIMLTNPRHLLKIGDELISVGALTGLDVALSEDSIILDTASVTMGENKFINITNQNTSGNMSVGIYSTGGTNGNGGGGTPPAAPLPNPPQIAFNYTYHDDTLLTEIDYYVYDHLGNTRVVYQPEFIQRLDIINSIGFIDGTLICPPNSSLCSAWSPVQLANPLISPTTSYNNTNYSILVNSQSNGAEYAIETNVTTVVGQYYTVEFTIDDNGSQLDNKFAEASGNGVVLVNTGYSSNNTIIFAFTANSTTTTFKVGALDDAAPALRNFSLIGSVVTPTDLGYELKYAADYYPYGKILREWQPATGPEKYLTTHHERDTETGLDYRGARYYDSDIARFLSLDPSAKKYANLSPYNYVAGNPVMLIDPDGKDSRVALTRNEGGGGTIKISSVAHVYGKRAEQVAAKANEHISELNMTSTYTDADGGVWTVEFDLTFKVNQELVDLDPKKKGVFYGDVKGMNGVEAGDNFVCSDCIPKGGSAEDATYGSSRTIGLTGKEAVHGVFHNIGFGHTYNRNDVMYRSINAPRDLIDQSHFENIAKMVIGLYTGEKEDGVTYPAPGLAYPKSESGETIIQNEGVEGEVD